MLELTKALMSTMYKRAREKKKTVKLNGREGRFYLFLPDYM
jgi:hypothetical protein